MLKLKAVTSLILLVAITQSFGQDPFPDSTRKYIEQWKDSRFGMFIHWGPISLKGTEIGWSRSNQVPRAEYDTLYKHFNPAGFNAKEWVDLAKAGGMRYITLIMKHHDGFSMYDSKFTDYDIMSTPFGRDVAKELSEECKRQGIRFDTYYSIPDWYRPDWPTTASMAHGGPGYPLPAGQTQDPMRYKTFLENQLSEIITKYDPGVIWYDGFPGWALPGKWTAAMNWEIYKQVKNQKPSIIQNSRIGWSPDQKRVINGYAGDYGTPERKIGAFNDSLPWETCNTIAAQWAFKPNNPVRATKNYIYELINVIGGDGNWLLNLDPGPDGRFVARETDKLKEIGKWTLAHGDGIYGTRGGPFMPGTWGGATHKGNLVYVHILEWPNGDKIYLPALTQKIVSYRRLGNQSAVRVLQNEFGISIGIPQAGRDTLAETVELTLDAPITSAIHTVIKNTVPVGFYGSWLSKASTYEQSSSMAGLNANRDKLLTGVAFDGDFAFHTQNDPANPFIIIDLDQIRTVKALEIVNRTDSAFWDRAATLTVWTSTDKATWKEAWTAEGGRASWVVEINDTLATQVVGGANARYVKIGLKEATWLHLKSVKVFGELGADQYTTALGRLGGGNHPFGKGFDLDRSRDGRISYALSRPGHVVLEAMDVSGAILARLADRWQDAGQYALSPLALPSHPKGMVILKLSMDGRMVNRKILE